MSDFNYAVDSDGIATITWDIAHKSMNILSFDGLKELEQHIDTVLSDDTVIGAVITSGKDSFAAGMDLNILATMKENAGNNPAEGLFDGIMNMHRVLRKIERAGMNPKDLTGGKPIVAALPGTCLGIGTEISLACHRIFAADNRKAKIGLPEILIGIFPGAGGTVRISKKLGLMQAAPLLLEGKLLNPTAAQAAGFIDEVVAADSLLDSAKDWVKNANEMDIVKPWDKKGYKMPGGTPYHPAGFPTFLGAAAMTHGKTQGVYPAAKALLSVIYESAEVDFDTALRIEARWFTHVLMNPSSSAMINTLFLNKSALEKGAARPKNVGDMRVKKVGVLGAGMMGAGIAHVSAIAGINVVLIDQTLEAANRGKAHSEAILDESIKRKKIDTQKKTDILSRIQTSCDFNDLDGCDLVVEAVFEEVSVKAKATQNAEAHLNTNAVFATNTSTLPITELAKASRNESRYIGIHFFSPVHKMQLVEIIKGEKTGDDAVAKALDFVRQLRKTPIVVNDARFFYANRCIIPYLNEGVRMLAEGVEPALIENAAKLLGMPLGPLQLTDEISIDLSVKIAKATKQAMGANYPESPADEVLFKLFDEGRLGRKTHAGFYAYNEQGKRLGFWPELTELWHPSIEQPTLDEVKHRLILTQVLEAVRSLEENVLMDIREGDVGAILGWGFMPWSGGPFSWIDMMGVDKVVGICQNLEQRCGERFATPQRLLDMQKNNTCFYTNAK